VAYPTALRSRAALPNPSLIAMLRSGRAQLFNFSHDLRSPNLARRIGATVGRTGVSGVGMNPIKQSEGAQFLVQTRQAFCRRNISASFMREVTCLGETPVDSPCRSIGLAGRFDRARLVSPR
jgi:hypothetical protein